jgi:Tfp pilus assembly protein PilN
MRFQVNLSHQPFYNRRLFWLGVLALLVVTGILSLWTLRKIDESADRVQELQTKIAEQNLQLKRLKATPPQGVQHLTNSQMEQLQAAASLIEQHNFSWTAMLEEFERSLPPTVRLVNIALKESKEKPGAIPTEGLLFSVKVLTKTPEDVTKMIAMMDKRGLFQMQPNSQLPPGPTGDIGFDIDVNYLPQHRTQPAAKKVKNDQVAKGGEVAK